MYARFRKAYYRYDCYKTLLTVATLLSHESFVIIDCSRQNESTKLSHLTR